MKLFLLIISMEGNKETISVLAVVASSPENFAKRLAIRQTWKNQLVLSETYKSRNSSSEAMHSGSKGSNKKTKQNKRKKILNRLPILLIS